MSTQGDITYIVEGRDLSQTTQFRAVESVDEFGRVMAGKPTIQILCKHLGNISGESSIPTLSSFLFSL